MENRQRRKGTVNWFSGAKGYGFIKPDEGGRDIFVHYSGINGEGYKELLPNQRVEFTILEAGKGPQAIDVCVIE